MLIDIYDVPPLKKKNYTKLNIRMCSQILTMKSTAPSSSNFCRFADFGWDSWSLRKMFTFKTSDSK